MIHWRGGLTPTEDRGDEALDVDGDSSRDLPLLGVLWTDSAFHGAFCRSMRRMIALF